jgi:hypothetical protein
MNFGKYSVVDSLEHHFELEREWYWLIRPATSGDDLAMAKYYVDNTRSVIIDGKRVEQPPLWMEVMYREIAMLFNGTNIPKDPKKPNVPVLDNKASIQEVEAVLATMPEKMVEEIWKALGETNPFWGPRLYQPETVQVSLPEGSPGKAN